MVILMQYKRLQFSKDYKILIDPMIMILFIWLRCYYISIVQNLLHKLEWKLDHHRSIHTQFSLKYRTINHIKTLNTTTSVVKQDWIFIRGLDSATFKTNKIIKNLCTHYLPKIVRNKLKCMMTGGTSNQQLLEYHESRWVINYITGLKISIN
jgi:hypothetical protein